MNSYTYTILVIILTSHFDIFEAQPSIDGDCKCWTPYYRRTSCRYGARLNKATCLQRGCCYEPKAPNLYARNVCFERSAICPAPKCRVDLSKREKCNFLNGYYVTRQTCESRGCCYDTSFKPRCYKSAEASITGSIQPTIKPSRPLLPLNHYQPHLFRKHHSIGPYNFIASCGKKTRRCGKYKTTREQCIRFGCCWEPIRARNGLYTPSCFHGNHRLIFRKNQIDLMFVVDGSTSVGLGTFEIITTWLSLFVQLFNIDGGMVNVGVVSYGSSANTAISLGQFSNEAMLSTAIQNIVWPRGVTETITAIRQAKAEFQGANSRFPRSRRVLVLITDGPRPAAFEITPIVGDEIEYFVVRFGNEIAIPDTSLWQLLTGNSENIFDVNEPTFASLTPSLFNAINQRRIS